MVSHSLQILKLRHGTLVVPYLCPHDTLGSGSHAVRKSNLPILISLTLTAKVLAGKVSSEVTNEMKWTLGESLKVENMDQFYKILSY